MCQRIKAYIDDNRISLNALAKTLNMNQSTVLRQVKGEQTLSSTLVENFLKAYPKVSAEWLMRGVGTMYVKEDVEYSSSMVAETPCHDEPKAVEPCQDDSVWKAKYEAIKDCYDMLVSNLGGVIGKRSVG